ncbi:hypothetical protein MWU49_08860 [Alcanivorax sp. S6407]|uniref:hypothetical protein n=1 Tax=Alcanivorax sp. S6407 TaxID=2926424 RepID=UPI001FF496BE|nr:hypothetical protein [Alcanivorax sp. S6407]MCK0153811.1 hypothetical protein [Alcanivorax sp. S6407]
MTVRKQTSIYALSLAAAFSAQPVMADLQQHSQTHRFSIADVIGGFDGSLAADDATIICDDEAPCATDTIIDQKTGATLYPIDSEFGYQVADFVGAAQKTRDNDYAEGWVADYTDPEAGDGLIVSNAATDTFKVGKPLGTWCAGLGGESVKCSTEHYVTMEHIFTCNETVPYFYADPLTGVQQDILDPETGLVIDNCGNAGMDDSLNILANGIAGDLLTSMDQLLPNESTVRNDIATGDSYSITKKDDGKPLYRWGNLVKRPNDIRLYAQMPLPAEWKAEGANYRLVLATLEITHWITNNPNDQIRPEDMENEGATGELPDYYESGEYWYAIRDCYEGDGDFIPAGTVLRNGNFTAPSAFSADLQEGLTNAWYTSTDRDPFLDSDSCDSGPRWRLKSNKFGQDIPGLEIPAENCSAPPFSSSNIKYEVGMLTTTTIDLLDWEDGIYSPLMDTQAWVDSTLNDINLEKAGNAALSVNGLPMSEDFDLAVYVKGDRKATALFDANLNIVWDDTPNAAVIGLTEMDTVDDGSTDGDTTSPARIVVLESDDDGIGSGTPALLALLSLLMFRRRRH